MIQIVHWILTRRCNLKCYYCRIARNYKSSPYPKMKYFLENEIELKKIIEGLEWFKNHNPDCFHLFYGGEPLLRDDLPEIIEYCNQNEINYTIISNGFDQRKIKKLFTKVEYVRGFTCSIDPILMKFLGVRCNTLDKSVIGLKTLKDFKNWIVDPVAEITCDRYNIKYIYPLVKKLTSEGICSDITAIDISKNKYYDFSNVTDENLLLQKTDELVECFKTIVDSGLNVHLPEILPEILNTLPSEMDCNPIERLNNLVIDSDGAVRLCLRIRGIETPKKKFYEYIKENMLDELLINIQKDKSNLCSKCNWTCQLMINKKLTH